MIAFIKLIRIFVLLSSIASLVLLTAVEKLAAQTTDTRDLITALDTVSTQEGKVDILLALSDDTFNFDLQQSISHAREALKISESIGYERGIALANKQLGIGLAETGAFVEALGHLDKALTGFQELGDSLELANVYNNLGNQYSYGGNEIEARRYYDLALEMFENLKIPEKISALNNNIGTTFLNSGEPDSALSFLNRASITNLEIKNEEGLATNYINLGYAYADLGDFPKAVENYLKCIEIGKKTGNRAIQSVAYLNLGDAYLYTNELEKAIENTTMGLNIARADGYAYNEYTGLYTLGEIYEKKRDYKTALGWYLEAEELNEKLVNADNQAAMMNFQSEQLKKAQKAEIERINLLNEEQLKAEKFKNYMLLTAAASVLLMLLGASYYFMKKHRVTLQLAEQSVKIKEQSDKILEQAKDISAVNDTLRDRNLRLRKLNEEKNYLMSVVAHDLKSPLNQINGLVNVIKLTDDNLTKEQKECLGNIYVATDRLSEMVSKVLNREAIDSDQWVINKVKVDVRELLSDAIGNFQGVAERKNISLKKNFPSERADLFIDKQYLQQIIDNLLSNAIKFSPPGTEVEIGTYAQEDSLIIEVKDEGPGLTKTDMKNLFKEHMILSAKPTGDEISTGLGLSIVKNYTEKLGGEVWAESIAGQGASFMVRFPLTS